MTLFGKFHDGCIRELHAVTGHFVDENLSMSCHRPTTIYMLVQRQRREPSVLELRFEEVVELRMSPPPADYVAIIFQALFVLEDGVFYWYDDHRWNLQSGQQNDYTWIAARRVFWRDKSEWMGPSLRYRGQGE